MVVSCESNFCCVINFLPSSLCMYFVSLVTMHFAKGQGTHKCAAVTFITNAARVTFCCVIIYLSDRISLVTMLLCLLISTFYAKSQGSLKYVNGDEYIGDWKESKQHGYGTCTRANGDEYVGEWKAGKMHGHGTHKSLEKCTLEH